MDAIPKNKPGRTGRPRQFDREVALDKAMRLFWRNGFEGTSIADLTEAMGVAPPSLYAAFGDKARLYREALDRYASLPEAAEVARLAEAGDLETAVRAFLTRVVDLMVSGDRERGCMVSTAVISQHTQHADIAADLRRRRDGFRKDMTRALASRLPPRRAAAGARHLLALLQGLSLQARDGATRRQLMQVVTAAEGATAWRSPTEGRAA